MKTCNWTCSVITQTVSEACSHWRSIYYAKAVCPLESDVAVVNNVYLLLLVCCSSKHITGSSEALCASSYLAGAIFCSWIPVSKGSNLSYATDFSFMRMNISVKFVACWITDCQHLRKARTVIMLMLWGKCCKTLVRENCATDWHTLFASLKHFLNWLYCEKKCQMTTYAYLLAALPVFSYTCYYCVSNT